MIRMKLWENYILFMLCVLISFLILAGGNLAALPAFVGLLFTAPSFVYIPIIAFFIIFTALAYLDYQKR